MDANVLSLPKSDAVECPGRPLRQGGTKVDKDQLLSMIRLAVDRVEDKTPGRTQ